MKVLLYNHGTCYNHGCEAIIRTAAEIIGKRRPGAEFTVSSLRPKEDLEFIGKEDGDFRFIDCDFFNRFNFEKRRLILGSATTVLHNIPFFGSFFKNTVEAAKEADVMISVGGDTFSYGKSAELTTISNKLRKYCGKSVLLGCSIDEKYLVGDEYKYKIKGLKDFSLITARESITYDSLKKLGFENVKLYPDPAFTLAAKAPANDLFPNSRDIVGINISPLIIHYEERRDSTLRAYAGLIDRILKTTDLNVALVTHVICKTSNDTDAANRLLDLTGRSDRISVFDKGNAVELKGIISKCRFFVAARTHASIAAYSQKIPTLVVGYSVKSRGIAKDLFGTDEGFVVPVQTLNSEDSLSDVFFDSIVKNEDAIRSTFDRVMPGYIARADSVGDEICALIGNTGGKVW
ncbi:MAG: polysaccharide pyruvyl transferase family protein [Clostridia bacterium]|nr:polysaccharide pyruvyl transferase family protein [Clostridia bacterium]